MLIPLSSVSAVNVSVSESEVNVWIFIFSPSVIKSLFSLLSNKILLISNWEYNGDDCIARGSLPEISSA